MFRPDARQWRGARTVGASACPGLLPRLPVPAGAYPPQFSPVSRPPRLCGGASRPRAGRHARFFTVAFVRLPGLQDLYLFLFFSWKWATAEGRAVSRETCVFIFLFCLHVYFSAGIKKRPRRGEGYTNKSSCVVIFSKTAL